ncbi:MAG: MBL fold metallo-hydrolase [Bacteroidetes bacterium]|nr:MAG: MBL fold metallo-hydrolase [Bacteroidota bacterium]
MIHLKKFTFNPFAENTYLLYQPGGEAWIIDPGCYDQGEEAEVMQFLESENLKLTRLLLTHAHLDHIFGNHFIYKNFGLKPELHELDLPVLERGPASAAMYGVALVPSPEPATYLTEGQVLDFNGVQLEVRFCPGHAPGHVVFVCAAQEFVIGGDVLFSGSIGRTDLPGGNHETLLEAIRTQLYTLPDNYTVFCGHGPETSIGIEKASNPFVRG